MTKEEAVKKILNECEKLNNTIAAINTHFENLDAIDSVTDELNKKAHMSVAIIAASTIGL